MKSRAEIEQAIDENLDSIAFTEDGRGIVVATGLPATREDFDAGMRKDWWLRCMLRRARW